jgi:hypothetical protein
MIAVYNFTLDTVIAQDELGADATTLAYRFSPRGLETIRRALEAMGEKETNTDDVLLLFRNPVVMLLQLPADGVGSVLHVGIEELVVLFQPALELTDGFMKQAT